jgi:hypothetical protein
LSIFNGIGTKSRNGFGKFEILNDTIPLMWTKALQKLKIGGQNSFTSFSEALVCFKTEDTFENIEQALAEVGMAYKNAREFVDEPHRYNYRSYIASPIVDNKRQKSFLDRHAKSYFLSVVEENGEYRGIILYLPYLFLDNASGMLKELFADKEKRPNSTGINIENLRKVLIDTPIPKHQEYYTKSNGYFHKELIHNENPHALIKVSL